MNNYAVNDYGLLMSEDALKRIAMNVCNNYDEEEYDEDPDDFNYDLYEKGIVEFVGEFTGEAIKIRDDGIDLYGYSDMYNCDIAYYVPVSKWSTLFKAAYNNVDEMICEFKKKLGEYLPEDFDYRNNIRHIVGTYYG
jgi:hypothetical protein